MKRRWLMYIGGGFLALAVILTIAAVLVARSQWFRDQVRERIVFEVEKATGGQVEVGGFDFDWSGLRATVSNFVLHGKEPAGAPPLFRADKIGVELKIISVLRRMVDIAALDVAKPQVHLIVNADGSTNVPEPKIKKTRDKTAMETILDLAVRRFSVQDGVLEVTSRGKTPFHGKGENLRAVFTYDASGPRYRGKLSMTPLDFQFGDNRAIPMNLDVALVMEKNRIGVESATLGSGGSVVKLKGAIEDLTNPRGDFQYDVHLVLAEISKYIQQTQLPQGGVVDMAGNVTFTGTDNYKLNGKLNANNVDFRRGGFALQQFDTTGVVTATPERVQLESTRLSGTIRAAANVQPVSVSGRVADVTLRGNDLEVKGIDVAALGGTFSGSAALGNFDRYRVTGTLSGLHARAAAGLVTKQQLPWDAAVSGPVTMEGNLKGRASVLATARLDVTPAGESQPVNGNIEARYDSRNGSLDLGQSRIHLPNTTAEFSGSLGKTLRVHFETRNFDDLTPLLNLTSSGAPGALPVSLRNGTVIFDGTVTGNLQNPQVAGHVTATNAFYQGRQIDFVSAELTASPSQLGARQGVIRRAALQGNFEFTLGLDRWKPKDESAVTAKASMRKARLDELMTIAGQKNENVAGTLSFDAAVSGTVANPVITADLEASNGAVYGEPFDRLTAKVDYKPGMAHIGSATLTAGQKKLTAQASFEHPRDSFQNGRLLFQVDSNEIPLDSIQSLIKQRPDARGVLQLNASGAVDIDLRGKQNQFELEDLKASVSARGLRMEDQSVGNLRLVAVTQSKVLTAHLESDFADSIIKGDGQWKLTGDYPGSANIVFTRLNFANLRAWLSTGPQRATVGGFAEGSLKLEGPLRKPEQMRAELLIPKLEVRPRVRGELGAALRGYGLSNSGPIRITMANSVVTIEEARLTGRSTDLSLSGTLSVKQKMPIDIQAKGTIGLNVLEMADSEIFADGSVTLDAAVRGTVQQPSLNGKLILKGASFNYAQFPNGLGDANGVVVFSGNRVSIQTLEGTTGGGKVTMTGFVQLMEDPVFRLQATASQVRVRYPEGVSTLADATVNLTGTAARSLLSGKVTILRTGFNLRSDFSSVLAKTAEPVKTPAARTGFLSNMQLDINIETAPDIAFQTSVAQDLSAEAELRVRGTAISPSLLGRVNITQGEINFFGTKYTINQGTINFFNPVKIEPVLNIDLETKARGIDIILTVSGPVNKLNVTPRSDPPLQFSEIIALLATGRAPSSDPTLAARQATQQNWQQMGASALVGQAIANPVAGRLQRFFGVSRLKIDPSFSGVENNPQARLTLEQQITRDITFTYITNVTNSNPQVIRVEWAFSRQWSVIAVRDENGLFGLDFLYKRRF